MNAQQGEEGVIEIGIPVFWVVIIKNKSDKECNSTDQAANKGQCEFSQP